MQAENLTGKRFGRLVVTGEVPIHERSSRCREMICRCDCGNVVNVRISNLKSGNTRSCGCLAKEVSNQAHKALPNDVFGRLTVLCEAERSTNGHRKVTCMCECGNILDVHVSDLLQGTTRSCGCLRRENAKKLYTEDLTGKTFYELTALRKVETKPGERTKWLFRCSCGNEVVAMPINVKRGFTKTCGHARKSIAEARICDYLDSKGIQYSYNSKPFDNLVNSVTGRRLEIDFVIKGNNGNIILIEHQGKQHFPESSTWDQFGKGQRELTDSVKKEYCKEHNIKLYETLYNEDYISRVEEILKENELIHS